MSAYQYNVDEQVAAVKARLGQHKSAILSSSSAQVPTRCGDGAGWANTTPDTYLFGQELWTTYATRWMKTS